LSGNLSPPFFEGISGSLCDWPLPSEFSLAQVWQKSDSSIDPLVSNHTTEAINGFDFNPDGTRICVGNMADDEIYTHSLSTPFDVNSATAHSSFSDVNCNQARWFNSGTQFARIYDSPGDNIRMFDTSGGAYSTGGSSTTHSTVLKSDYWDGNQDGPYDISDDGTKLIWIGQYGAGGSPAFSVWIASITLSSAFDLSTNVTPADSLIQLDAGLGTAIHGDIRVNCDGLKLYYMLAEKLYLGTMTVAYDVSTMTWDTVNSLDVNVAGRTLQKFWVNTSGTVLYVADTDATDPAIYKYTA